MGVINDLNLNKSVHGFSSLMKYTIIFQNQYLEYSTLNGNAKMHEGAKSRGRPINESWWDSTKWVNWPSSEANLPIL